MSRVQLVWFKRDLRVRDHAPLAEAARRGPVLALYVYEPEVLTADDSHVAHLRFVNQCLSELADALAERGGRLVTRTGRLPEVFDALHDEVPFETLWSHVETGNGRTYARDRRVKRWCRERGVRWVERPQNGVVRALKTRDGWAARWERFVRRPLVPAPRRLVPATPVTSDGIRDAASLGLPGTPRPGAQRGGEMVAWDTLRGFLRDRGVDYRRAMASPLSAWDGCSRVSPHLAWGTLSIRQVLQATERRQQDVAHRIRRGADLDPRWPDSLRSYASRLRWHCHFIQKLESEPAIEFRNMNPAYDQLRSETLDRTRFEAWADGRTGWPLVDACMRALHETGWMNFRMRAMLVSVSSWTLGMHWREPALHLARLFVDYEPGIHFSQVQMQSGVTGINTPRLYNPTKQARDQDPTGTFIRQWVPELAPVPDAFVHEPWAMPPLTQRMCGVVIGRDYPAPLVDVARAHRAAKQALTRIRATPEARAASARVYQRHGSRRRPPARGWGGSGRR